MSLSRQASIYASFSALNVAVSYVLLLFIANVMSKEHYAAFGFYSSLMSLLLIAVNFGYKETFFKWSSQQRVEELTGLRDSFYPWLFGFFCIALVTAAFNFEAGLAGLGFISLYALTAVSGLNRGFEYYVKDASAIPTYRGVWLLGCLLIWWSWGELTVVGVFSAALVGSSFACLLFVTPRIKQLMNPFLVSVRAFQAPWRSPVMRHFFLVELATVAYVRVDMLFLKGLNVSDNAMAEYYFGIQILDAALLIIAPVSYLFFNRLNRSQSLWYRESVPYVAFMMALVLGIVGGWWLLGEWVLTVMFPQYTQSFDLALSLLLVLLPAAGTLIFSHLLFHWDDEWVYVKVCFAGLAVCVVTQALLIPALSEWGAVWARLTTESVIFVALLLFVLFKKRERSE